MCNDIAEGYSLPNFKWFLNGSSESLKEKPWESLTLESVRQAKYRHIYQLLYN